MNNPQQSNFTHQCLRHHICASWLLPLLLLALPAAVQAQFNYTTNNGTITITQYTGPSGAVTIPGTINGLSVTCIGPNAFWDVPLTSVLIPSSVTNIGDSAFRRCGLTSVTIPNGVTHIGDWAFAYCPIFRIAIPDSVTSIGEHGFYGCSGLTNVTIGNSVAAIGDWAFSGCTSLTAITVDAFNSAYSSADGGPVQQEPDRAHRIPWRQGFKLHHPQRRDHHRLVGILLLQPPGTRHHPRQRH